MTVSRNARLILTSKSVSLAGDAIFSIGFPLYVLQKTGRQDVFGYSLAIQAVCMIAVTIAGGYFADRSKSLVSCIAIDVVRAILVAALYLSLQTAFSVWTLYLLLILNSSLTAYYNVVLDGTSMRIGTSEDIAWLSGRSALSSQIFEVAGFGIGGIILSLLGYKFAFIVNSLSFLGAALVLVPVSRSFDSSYVIAEAGRTSRLGLNDFAKHIRSGVAYCLSDKYVFRVLCLAVFLNLVIATREVVWFPTLKLELRLSESEIGTLSSAVAAVIGLASLFVTKAAGDPSRRPVLLLTGQAAVVAGGFCFVIPPSITTVALGSVLIGVGGLMHGIPSALVRKERVPSHLQGAALAVARIVSRLVVPVTMFLTTWLSKTFGVTSVVAFMTTVAALASLAICAKRPVRWRVSGEVHHQ